MISMNEIFVIFQKFNLVCLLIFTNRKIIGNLNLNKFILIFQLKQY